MPLHQGKPPMDWWQWIVEHAAAKQPEMFFRAQDTGGETCIDLFLENWLSPSNKKRALFPFVNRFATCLDEVISSKDLMKELQSELLLPDDCFLHPLPTNDASNVTVVARFWRAFTKLCHAADPSLPMVPFLAQTGCCPEAVARLAIQLYPDQLEHKNELQHLPIHMWAVSPNPVQEEDRDGLLRPLLEAFPKAATIKDLDGRLPVHLALEHGKSLEQIHLLWSMVPQVLYVKDPIIELPCCGLVSLACRKQSSQVRKGLQKRHRNMSLNDWLDLSRDGGDRYQEEMKCEHLTHIYQVVRAYPMALFL
jgi:hypothetical protein